MESITQSNCHYCSIAQYFFRLAALVAVLVVDATPVLELVVGATPVLELVVCCRCAVWTAARRCLRVERGPCSGRQRPANSNASARAARQCVVTRRRNASPATAAAAPNARPHRCLSLLLPVKLLRRLVRRVQEVEQIPVGVAAP